MSRKGTARARLQPSKQPSPNKERVLSCAGLVARSIEKPTDAVRCDGKERSHAAT